MLESSPAMNWIPVIALPPSVLSLVSNSSVVVGHVPKMNLDDAFLQQSDIAVAIKQGLDDVMKTYGYAIDQALVTTFNPTTRSRRR